MRHNRIKLWIIIGLLMFGWSLNSVAQNQDSSNSSGESVAEAGQNVGQAEAVSESKSEAHEVKGESRSSAEASSGPEQSQSVNRGRRSSGYSQYSNSVGSNVRRRATTGSGYGGYSRYAQSEDYKISARYSPAWIKDTKLSLAVMAKLIERKLKETLGDSYRSRSFLQKGCQGYWLPGKGVMFTFNVDFPLYHQNGDDEKNGDSEKKDEWDRIMDEMIQRKDISKYDERFDQKKVDQLKETLLELIAQYGHRFSGFAGHESIIVVVDGTESIEQVFRYKTIVPEMEELKELTELQTKYKYGIEEIQKELERIQMLKETGRLSNSMSDEEIQLRKDLEEAIEKQRKDLENKRKVLKFDLTEKIEDKRAEIEQKREDIEKARRKNIVADSPRISSKTYSEDRLEELTYGDPGVSRTVIEMVAKSSYPSWLNSKTQQGSSMIIQVPFGVLPEEEGRVEDIKDKVDIVTY